MAVMKSLMAEARIRPRTGWVRADQARSNEDVQRERKLTADLREAESRVEKLERKIRDRAILGDEVSQDLLAQGGDVIEFTITFSDRDKQLVTEGIKLTWDEVLRVIGPSIYGFIWKKSAKYGQKYETYPFQDNLEEHFRAKIIDRVQNRRINIQGHQVDTCVLQFKELGLLQFAEAKDEKGKVFRGVTLTEEGERRLTLLSMRLREANRSDDVSPSHA
jgi:hypothetical protein